MDVSEKEDGKIKQEFLKRRSRRITLFVFALFFLLIVGFVAIPLMEMLQVAKYYWAPFVYLVMFGVIISIAYVWRCPVCNAMLGNVFTTKYCSKCGFKFEN